MVAAGERLHRFSPETHAEPRILGSIFRINRDIRFSKDKRPYRDHLDFWFWDGERKTAASGFFVRISPTMVGIGAGSHGFDASQRIAFRQSMANRAASKELADVASALEGSGYQLSSPVTARASSLYVHVDEPASLAGVAALVDRCAEHWYKLFPLHRWLVNHLQSAA